MYPTSQRIIAGVLEMVAGVLYLFYGFTTLITDLVSGTTELWLLFPQAWMVSLGVLALAGGVSATQGKSYGLALTGALLAIPLPPFLGIPASILLVISRSDWTKGKRRLMIGIIIGASVMALTFWVLLALFGGRNVF
ncbi:MAG: hypothetical protein HYX81_03080 [Chloroflexi bacterium]|nr:hypothetical protein [Chloroflexota bacterium]